MRVSLCDVCRFRPTPHSAPPDSSSQLPVMMEVACRQFPERRRSQAPHVQALGLLAANATRQGALAALEQAAIADGIDVITHVLID